MKAKTSQRARTPAAPDLTIRLKRHTDGAASLTLTRANGSVTWQRQNGQLGAFFPPHDLTHYAVETELGFRQGFYGLVADGWEITDFTSPWPRGPIPLDAIQAELVVGFFDAERRNFAHWNVDDFNEHARVYVAASRNSERVRPPELTQEQITRVRETRDGLFTRWHALAPGDSIELEFVRT